MTPVEVEKRVAAEAAAQFVDDGMTVGLGTGSTVAYLLPALARRRLVIRCVATSPDTQRHARAAGLRVDRFRGIDGLDIAIDGADQVAVPDGWVIKGGGGAHTREKIVAQAARRFVVVVSSNKLVDRLSPPVPLELLGFGLEATVARIQDAAGPVRLRPSGRTPDGGVLADYLGPIGDPAALAEALGGIAGVIAHGLFPPPLVSEVVVGRGGIAEILRPAR